MIEDKGTQYRTITGKFPVVFPEPEDLTIEAIAEGLSKTVRYNGQYEGDFLVTVAQHSVQIAEILWTERKQYFEDPLYRARTAMGGLLHDGSEGLLGDMISPIKAVLPDFRELEDGYQKRIYHQHVPGLPIISHQAIKEVDERMLDMECRELGRPTIFEYQWKSEKLRFKSERMHHHFNGFHWWGVHEARTKFLAAYSFYKLKIEQAEKMC